MKVAPLVGAAVEAGSRAHRVRAVLVNPDGSPQSYMPVQGGSIRADSRPGDRWSATLTLPGEDYRPDSAAHPLSGFTGHRVRLDVGTRFDERVEYVPVCELIIAGTQLNRTREVYDLQVRLEGLAEYVDATAPRAWTPTAGEKCAAMIARVVGNALPSGWSGIGAVIDQTSGAGSTTVPSDYAPTDTPPWKVVSELSDIANVTTYVDDVGQVIIRDPLPSTPGTPARTLTTDRDLLAYTLTVGRSQAFANRVELTCDNGTTQVVGVAEHALGPTGTGTIGRRTRAASTRTGTISQAAANARAATILGVTRRAWFITEADVLPDPRLEPDDTLALVYTDGSTVLHRLTAFDLALDTGAARLAMRTFDDPMPTTTGA